MKHILAAVLAVAALAAPASAADPKPTAVDQTLIQMELEWARAGLAGDATALGKILADDWSGLGPDGTFTRAQVLEDLRSGATKITSSTPGPMKVRVFGDTAIVTGSHDEKSTYKGKDTSGHWTWTDVFVKRKGKWQAVASQSTLVAPK